MLHVFLVDIGLMLKFDMGMVVESVASLMDAVLQKVYIPTNKQVLLSANGEPLLPTNRVASYPSIGTETHPIFLFSKSTIESPMPPSPSENLGSEAPLKEAVEKSLKMKANYETLVSRAQLAVEFERQAVDIGENCESIVNEQFLQSDGWRAVVLNLDHITSAFEQHVNVFGEYYKTFLLARHQYGQMAQSYEQVVTLLKQLPLLPCLLSRDTETPSSLLDWVSSHDKESSLENLVRQCQESLEKCNEAALEEIVNESHKILDNVHNVQMREIKGLQERLSSLRQRLNLVRQITQHQSDMAQGFQQNQKRAEHVRDPSVLPDLCASHQKQLIVLSKNHHQLREIRNLFVRAKDELSANLHARLRWVMAIEKTIFGCDSKLIVYHENLKRIKKRLDICEQVFEAPKMYVLAVLEVLRRKNFSVQFKEWAVSVSQSSSSARTEELSKREMFQQVFGNHFVKNLFPGLDNKPKPFAEELVHSADDQLPEITTEDIKLLQTAVPELMTELHLGDPLESSTIVRDCLSQSNLTKLIDPRQNKTLEETLAFREKALVDNKLTISVLKHEISLNNVNEGEDAFPFTEKFPQIRTSSAAAEAGNSPEDEVDFSNAAFEPASLQSLSKEKIMTTSSESETLFHSAELDFSGTSPVVSSPPSNKSSSGKSSSSPINIKGTGSGRLRLSRSFSLEDNPTCKEEVLSLPILRAEEMFTDAYRESANGTNAGDGAGNSKENSQNSCRSLSEAIKAIEVNENIMQSSELLLRATDEIRTLKEQLLRVKDDTRSLHQTMTNEMVDSKTTLLRMCQCVVKESSALGEQLEESYNEKELLTKEIETLKMKLTETGDWHSKQCANSEAEFQSQLNVQQKRIEELTIQHQAQVLELTNQHQKNIDELTTQHSLSQESKNQKLEALTKENELLNVRCLEYEADRAKSEEELLNRKNKLEELKVKLEEQMNILQTDLHNRETECSQLYENNQRLTVEVDELKTLYENTLKENNELQTSFVNLGKEKGDLYASNQNLMKEKRELEENYDKSVRDKEESITNKKELLLKYESLVKEHENFTISSKIVSEEKNKLEQSLKDALTEQEKMRKSCEKTLRENETIRESYDGVLKERDDLAQRLTELSDKSQQSIDEHLSHVSTVTVQHKELKKLLAEKEQELSRVLQMKDSLEAQKQTNFNAVFNKIKKEKGAQLKDISAKCTQLEKDLAAQRNRNDTLNHEINVHKEAYSTLENDYKKMQQKYKQIEEQGGLDTTKLKDRNANLEQQLEQEARKLKKLETEYEEKSKTMATEFQKETAKLQQKNKQLDQILKNEQAILQNENECLQTEKNKLQTRIVEMEELNKTLIEARLRDQNKQTSGELEGSAKSSGNESVLGAEKGSALEKSGCSEHVIKITSPSIEEGLDMLEVDQLFAKIKKLEADNERLRNIAGKSVSISPKAQKVVRTSDPKAQEKIALRDLDVGSLIILCFDDTTHQYVALTLTTDKYFLHPDSLREITAGRASERRQWMFAFITEKELCVAKKANNKFNLPVNTYFSRIHVKLYENNR